MSSPPLFGSGVDRLQETSRSILSTAVPFAVAGTAVAVLLVVGFRQLAVPVVGASVGTPGASLLPIHPTPYWVEPSTIRIATVNGLKPRYLGATIVVWLLSILAISIAIALVIHRVTRQTDQPLPDRSRLGSLYLYVVTLSLLTLAIEDVFAERGFVSIVGVLVLVITSVLLFVGPVAIVRDSCSPLEAARFSASTLSPANPELIVIVLLLGITRHLLTGLSVLLAGSGIADAVTIVFGTAILGTVHTLAMCHAYDHGTGSLSEHLYS